MNTNNDVVSIQETCLLSSKRIIARLYIFFFLIYSKNLPFESNYDATHFVNAKWDALFWTKVENVKRKTGGMASLPFRPIDFNIGKRRKRIADL